MKEKDDLHVRKIGEAQKRVRSKSRRIQFDAAFDAPPDIVSGFHDGAADDTDRPELDGL
jgi:hypothetical protein